MDIVICKELQQQIVETSNKSKGFTLKSFSDCRQPIRFAILPDDMPDTRIDVLREIKGIHLEKDRVFEDSIDIDAPYKVINPTTAMIAKAENCATLEQNTPTETRNDFNHLRLLIPIVHNFLKELVDNCDPESKDGQREIIGFLKKIKKASQTPNFIRGMQKAGVSLRDAIPTQHILNSSLEVLKNYLDHTFLGNHPKSPKKSEPEIQ